jgi:hypothetical protein
LFPPCLRGVCVCVHERDIYGMGCSICMKLLIAWDTYTGTHFSHDFHPFPVFYIQGRVSK